MNFESVYEYIFNISRKVEIRERSLIQTIADHLGKSHQSSSISEEFKQNRKQEEEILTSFIENNNLWVSYIDFSTFVSSGAEQKVYLSPPHYVLKLNDAIYYETWFDYFLNLLLHNYFFEDTSYQLIGFFKIENRLHAVLKQNFVQITKATNLSEVKAFLEANGFKNTRNNDYYNEDLSIILEDLHDENVLSKEDILYFIDTVFYLKTHN